MFSRRQEPPHDKTNKMTCAPSEDSDQPGHRPVWPESSLSWSESSLSAWKNLGPLLPSERTAKTLIRLVDAQPDLSLRWAHMLFCWFCHVAAHNIKLVYELLYFFYWFVGKQKQNTLNFHKYWILPTCIYWSNKISIYICSCSTLHSLGSKYHLYVALVVLWLI